MQIENQSTKCLNCKDRLTWINHSKQWKDGREVDEFSFYCEACRREYAFREGRLHEKQWGRNPILETVAINRTELQAALNRRCSLCGGPIVDSPLSCGWCGERYLMENGELLPKPPEKKPRPKMSDFTDALHSFDR